MDQLLTEKVPSTFENAVTATGFGKFNIFLLLLTLPANFAAIFETTTMSYIFSSAQCDLNLSLEDKGLLNSVAFIGMISGGMIWGFLSDTFGRKRLLIGGFLLDGLFVSLSSLSQSLTPLIISKFLGGFIINGPFAAMSAYLSEFHCSKHRSRIQMTIGTINAIGTVVLPLLAWIILPQPWEFKLFGGVYHSWNVYLLICSLPAFYGGIIFIFLPESPKFLMTIGQNEKALKLFKKVYSINTGEPEDSFPITELVDETTLVADGKYGVTITANRTKKQALKEGWQQMIPLLHSPYRGKMILVCLIQICNVQSLNMIRLWLPQIFQAMEDYQLHHNGTTDSLCIMLQELNPKKNVTTCTTNMNNSPVYINSIIVGLVSLVGYFIIGTVINVVGKKKLLILISTASSICCLYLSKNSVTAVALSSIFNGLMSVCANVVLSVVVAIFPTTLRTLALSVTMMIARIGAVFGNLFFPVLLQIGCFTTFSYIAGVVLCTALLGFLLPNTENKELR